MFKAFGMQSIEQDGKCNFAENKSFLNFLLFFHIRHIFHFTTILLFIVTGYCIVHNYFRDLVYISDLFSLFLRWPTVHVIE